MKIYIDIQTGNWGEFDGLRMVEFSDLPEDAKMTLISGDPAEVGTQYGKTINDTDVNFSNSIAYSPSAVREEVEVIKELGINWIAPEEIDWVLNNATDDDLDDVACYVLASDDVWIDYRSNLCEGIRWKYDLMQEALQDSSTDESKN